MFSASDGRTERVAACSPEACDLGVRLGMRTPEAEALAGQGRLTKLAHDPGADRRALAKLAAECELFSPAVGIEDAELAESLLLDATGLAILWGTGDEQGEASLARAVQQWFFGKRLRSRIAVAATPGLALAATRYAEWLTETTDGAPLVLGTCDDLVDRLPIEALRIDPGTIEMLRSLGVETVGVLRGLPRSSLHARFGPALLLRLDQLTGFASEPIVSVRQASPLAASWQFESPVSDAEVLSRTVHRMLEKLSKAMRDRRCGALRVLITYELDSAEPAAERIALRLYRPTASVQELQELAELHASRLRLWNPVRAIHVLVGATEPLDCRQRTLFDEDARADPHELTMLINRLASRIGQDRVSRVKRRQSIDPEQAYALVPATDNPPSRFEQTPSVAEKTRRLPLVMLGSKSVSVRVTTRLNGDPALVRWPGERRVIRCWGPERVETGWWRGRGLQRDAYWVELDDGARLWLTLDLRTKRWRIAGEFA